MEGVVAFVLRDSVFAGMEEYCSKHTAKQPFSGLSPSHVLPYNRSNRLFFLAIKKLFSILRMLANL